MGWTSLFERKGNKVREAAVRAALDHVNALELEQAAGYLAEDFKLVDVGGSRIDGRDAFLERYRLSRAYFGEVKAVIVTLSHNADEVLVRGELESADSRVRGAVCWRFCFDGDRISLVETMREGRGLTLPKFHPRTAVLKMTNAA